MDTGANQTNTAGVPETSNLIASDKIEGTAVYGKDREKIGSVHNFVVDKESGKASCAVMSFGGFLEIGESYHPLPWNTLTYDTDLGGYVVDVTRQQLADAPHYAANEQPRADPEYGRRVHGHYGTPFGL